MKYFEGIKTIEGLKRAYKELALINHPDRGGDVEVMKAINAEYDVMFEKVKNIRTAADGSTYEKANSEAPAEFKDIIDRLMKMAGIDIEIIGSFVWVSGDTKPVKDILKEMGFRWSSNKSRWYKAPADYRKRSRKTYTIESIREMYGTSGVIKSEGYKQIAG